MVPGLIALRFVSAVALDKPFRMGDCLNPRVGNSRSVFVISLDGPTPTPRDRAYDRVRDIHANGPGSGGTRRGHASVNRLPS
jgi:hypothetical protein